MQAVTANEQLLRRDDPHHEIRELTIYQTDHGCELWERITFLSDDAPSSHGMVAIGTWSETKEKFDERLAALEQEGFDLCRPARIGPSIKTAP
jgi:hypothetical protein